MKELLVKLKDFIVLNKKQILAVALLGAMYAAKKLPGLEAEQELLDQLWALLVLGAVGLVPSFRMKMATRADDAQEPPP